MTGRCLKLQGTHLIWRARLLVPLALEELDTVCFNVSYPSTAKSFFTTTTLLFLQVTTQLSLLPWDFCLIIYPTAAGESVKARRVEDLKVSSKSNCNPSPTFNQFENSAGICLPGSSKDWAKLIINLMYHLVRCRYCQLPLARRHCWTSQRRASQTF